MTNTSWSTAPITDTDANFRLWGAAISAALAAIGLVQTSDTGQVNWTTVARTASTNTVQGYEIWRFDDSSQGSYPIYIKVEYGTGGSANTVLTQWTIGTGSNGSGTIANPINGGTSSTRVSSSSSSTSTLYSSYACAPSDKTGFSLSLWVNSTYNLFVSIERARDLSGAVVPNRIIYLHRSGNVVGTTQEVLPLQAGGTAGAMIPEAVVSATPSIMSWRPVLSASISLATGPTLYLPVLYATDFNGVMLTSLIVMGAAAADFSEGQIISVPRFSSTRSYKSIGVGLGESVGARAGFTPGDNYLNQLVLWE